MTSEAPYRGSPRRPVAGEGVGDGPRFDLRFEAGRGLLRLSRPLTAGRFRVSALDLGLGRVRYPVDVTAGALAFRHRRTTLRAATFHLDSRDLGRIAAHRDVSLMLGDSPSASTFALGLRDEFGVIGLSVAAFALGRDLRFYVQSFRAATDGPANPFRRIVVAARRLGLAFDAEGGFFCLPGPARRLLSAALCTRGFRLPNDRSVDISSLELRDGAFVLRIGDDAASNDAGALEAAEDARFMAPVLARLAEDDVDGAAEAALALVQSLASRPGAEDALRDRAMQLSLTVDAERRGAEEVVLEALAGRDDPFSVATRIRLSVRIGDRSGVADAIERLVTVEPLSDLVAEAFATAKSSIFAGDPQQALALLTRAAARRPGDVGLALERVRLALQAGDPREVQRAAAKALGAPLPSRDRARIVSAAALALHRLDRSTDAERLYREALFACPDEPSALEGLAGLFAARGDRAAAVLRLDRAARAHVEDGNPAAAARLLRRAAELLRGAQKPSAAEARLLRALRLTPRDPALCCALARVRVQLGDCDGAVGAYDLLLGLEGLDGAPLGHALVEAACFNLDDLDDPDGARPFVDMLGRRDPDDSRSIALLKRIEVGEKTLAGSIPAPLRRRPTETDPNIDVTANTQLLSAEDLAAADGGDDSAEATDPDVLATLEAAADEPRARASLARALSNALRRRGNDVEAARALARAGVLERDLAVIRAALDLADRAGSPGTVRSIIDRSLTIVGDGPARAALLERRRRAAREDEGDD